MKTRLLVLGLLLATAQSSLAEPNNDAPRLGAPAYGGTGCPAGTASVSLAPTGDAAVMVLDSFVVEAGGSHAIIMDRKSCDIAIPVHVPAGYAIALDQAEYRGYLNLPQGAQARLGIEQFFAGTRGPRTAITYQGPKSQDFVITTPSNTSPTWSACGQDVIVRVSVNLVVQTNSAKDAAVGTIDRGALTRLFKTKKCPETPAIPTPQ
jgi:hypothetical protein